jgi:hypothetical protein
MADGTVARSPRGCRAIRAPISEEVYAHAVDDPAAFRRQSLASGRGANQRSLAMPHRTPQPPSLS